MDLVPGERCKSVLSLLYLSEVLPGLVAYAVVVEILLHGEKAVQCAFLHFVLMIELFDAAILGVDRLVHFSYSVVSSA